MVALGIHLYRRSDIYIEGSGHPSKLTSLFSPLETMLSCDVNMGLCAGSPNAPCAAASATLA